MPTTAPRAAEPSAYLHRERQLRLRTATKVKAAFLAAPPGQDPFACALAIFRRRHPYVPADEARTVVAGIVRDQG